MNRIALSLLIALAGVPVVAAAPPAAPPMTSGAPKAESLSWLAGCWALVDGEPGAGEVWMAPAAGTLVGVSRSVKDGRTVGWELMRIGEKEGGGLEFVAQPSGQEGGAFPLVRLGPGEAVFENLKHDFPQRVVYRLDADGILRARIEGHANGEERGVDFPMRRVTCEVAPTGAGH